MKSFLNKKMIIATALLFVSLSVNNNIFAVVRPEIEENKGKIIKMIRQDLKIWGCILSATSVIGVFLAERNKKNRTSLDRSYLLYGVFLGISFIDGEHIEVFPLIKFFSQFLLSIMPAFFYYLEPKSTTYYTTVTPNRLRVLRITRVLLLASMVSSLYSYYNPVNMTFKGNEKFSKGIKTKRQRSNYIRGLRYVVLGVGTLAAGLCAYNVMRYKGVSGYPLIISKT